MTVTVVIGPPAAGKTTYVHQHAAPGDIVVDLDALAGALSTSPVRFPRTYPDAVRSAACEARNEVIRWLHMFGDGQPPTSWIIHALPTPAELDMFRLRGWHLQVIDPGKPEVYRRIAARDADAQGWAKRGAAIWYRRGSIREHPALVVHADHVGPSRDW